MSAAELDEHTLATLSQEERDALAEHQEDLKAMAAEEAAGGDDDDGDDGAEEAAAAADAAPTAQAKPEPAPEPAPAAEVAAEGEAPAAEEPAVEAPRPVYTATLPEDFEAQVAAVKAKEAEAWAAFEEGSIDRTELQQRLGNAQAEAQSLNNIKVKADLAREMAEQAEADAVRKAAAAIIKQGKAQGIDYEADDSKWEDLRSFADQVERRNPGKGPDWVLAEAHKRVLALHGVSAPAPAPSPAPAPVPTPAAAKKAALDARKPDLTSAPRDLAQVPGGDGPGDVAGEFSDILALDGEEYESALARMTPAQRDRFMQVV